MKTKNFKKSLEEAQFEKHLKRLDDIELPAEDLFFDQLHEKIMLSVEKTEVKPLSKWAKTWVFLERQVRPLRHNLQTAAKRTTQLAFVTITLMLAYQLTNLSYQLFDQSQKVALSKNQQKILEEAKMSPDEWTDLVTTYQNESDFYADVLSKRTATIVELDQVLSESL